MMMLRLLLSLVYLCGWSLAFQTGGLADRLLVPSPAISQNKNGLVREPLLVDSFRRTHLYYRPLDSDDDDMAKLQVQTRCPWFGFDFDKTMKERLAEVQRQVPQSALNTPLITALLLNQVAIVVLASVVFSIQLVSANGFSVFSDLATILQWQGNTHPFALGDAIPHWLIGVVGALPLIALSNAIEKSDNRLFANINFSTIVMTLTLFGSRTVPPPAFLPPGVKPEQIPTTNNSQALAASVLLSTMTGICEEVVFRWELPAVLALNTHSVLWAYLGQAMWFALGHAQIKRKRRVGLVENGVVIGLQFINGLGFGLLYLLADGDLTAPIIAHTLYDLSAFYQTWLAANAQTEYANQKTAQPLSSSLSTQLAAFQRQMDPKVFQTIVRLFYIFDYNKNETLDRSEVRKGMSYLALERGAGKPPSQETVDELFDKALANRRASGKPSSIPDDRLALEDFLSLYAGGTGMTMDTRSSSSAMAGMKKPLGDKQGNALGEKVKQLFKK